ncbi:MAG TPA: PHP domain-containing protein, partial [Bacillota bacterium]|nr:PHP domain-containing protein [Bacillota bacterium]
MNHPGGGRADLHLHSNRSDGLYAPQELVHLVSRAGLKAAALTDHDTVEGIAEALAAGKQLGFEVVPGVEISSFEDGVEIHLLGYYPADLDFLDRELKRLRQERFTRMERMVERLNRLGFDVNPQQVFQEAAPAAPGRLHLARFMVKHKLAGSIEQAFKQFLERGRPAYVPRVNLTPAAALKLLLGSGAVPVLAHPGKNGARVLPALLEKGLKGIEVIHPDHSAAQKRFYRKLAQEKGLLLTGGSDFHGDKPYRASGRGSATVPYGCLEQLKAFRF